MLYNHVFAHINFNKFNIKSKEMYTVPYASIILSPFNTPHTSSKMFSYKALPTLPILFKSKILTAATSFVSLLIHLCTVAFAPLWNQNEKHWTVYDMKQLRIWKWNAKSSCTLTRIYKYEYLPIISKRWYRSEKSSWKSGISGT